MTDVTFTREMVMHSWIRAELDSLWNALETAHRRTIGNNGIANRERAWSMECDGIAERIRSASALVGPVDWRESIGMSLIIDGWYAWANEKVGVLGAIMPTEDDVDGCRKLLDVNMRLNARR